MIQDDIVYYLFEYLLAVLSFCYDCYSRAQVLVRRFSPTQTWPSKLTSVFALLFFILFLAFGLFAILYPTTWIQATLIGFSALVNIFLFALVINDYRKRGIRKYKENLANTILTVSLSIIIFTLLYVCRWRARLHLIVEQTQTDTVSVIGFPAVAIMQDTASSQHANLLNIPQHCDITSSRGYWSLTDGEPKCDSLSQDMILGNRSCNCGDSWYPQIRNDLPPGIAGLSLNYTSLRPSSDLISNATDTTLGLQFFWNYNTSYFTRNYQLTPQPMVWMLIYDPRFSLYDAYKNNYGVTILVNANSVLDVSLNLNYLEGVGKIAHYEYDATISSIPNEDLICDVSKGSSDHCYTTILIRIASFDRTIIVWTSASKWTDVIAEAGAYFAFVQFLSWILSGQFWA
ncbi:hypothetical protein EV356DRAFT_528871 [Viridothelium virens]|uniref:Uncharacterized protein n=1 Tax=Viridothelium virens TaxID=1048519 RepID=A0A6A6HMF5_VIRVR|nr:hypothetical protein EV356DRAFT_528871 [Viridothelium virens]